MRIKSLCFILVTLLLSACFGGIYKPGSVRGFDAKRNWVLTYAGGAYRIGRLPSNWVRKDVEWRAVLFENKINHSTITVSSWCKDAFSDAPIKLLDREITHGLSRLNIRETKMVTLDGNQAKRSVSSGEVDGEDVYLRTYVLKKDRCVFDFAYVSRPYDTRFKEDFDAMVLQFKYMKGPKVL